MAELGIAASVVQLADFGLRLSVKLYTFSEAVASAPATVKEISTEVSLTSSVLKSLGDNLAKDKQLRLCSQHAIESTEKTVTECLRVFKELEDALTKSMARMGLAETGDKKKQYSRGVAALERLKWPFLQSKMQLLRSNLDRLKASLTLMLEVLNYARQVAERTESPAALQTQRAVVEALARSNQEYAKKFEALQKAIEDNQAKQAEFTRESAQGAHDPPPVYIPQSHVVLTDGSMAASMSRGPPSPPPPPQLPPPEPLTAESRQDLAIEGIAEELAHYCRLINTMLEEVDSAHYKLEQGTRMRIREDVGRTHLRESRLLAGRHDLLQIAKAIGSMKTLKSLHVDPPRLKVVTLDQSRSRKKGASAIRPCGEVNWEDEDDGESRQSRTVSFGRGSSLDNHSSELSQSPVEQPPEVVGTIPIPLETIAPAIIVKMPVPGYGVERSWAREEAALLEGVAEAEPVLEMKKKTLGEEHPETLQAMNRLARYYASLGWTEKALEMKGKELEIKKKGSSRMPPNWRQAIERIAAEAAKKRALSARPDKELMRLGDESSLQEQAMAAPPDDDIRPPPQHIANQETDDSEPEPPTDTVQSPIYVNIKQSYRILKRREARQKLEVALRQTSSGRKPYLHESRHGHEIRRPRGPGGRFLTADEVAKMQMAAEEREPNEADGPTTRDGTETRDRRRYTKSWRPAEDEVTKRLIELGLAAHARVAVQRLIEEDLSASQTPVTKASNHYRTPNAFPNDIDMAAFAVESVAAAVGAFAAGSTAMSVNESRGNHPREDGNTVTSVVDKYEQMDEPIAHYVAPPELWDRSRNHDAPRPDADVHFDSQGRQIDHASLMYAEGNVRLYQPGPSLQEPDASPYYPEYSFTAADDGIEPPLRPVPVLRRIAETPPPGEEREFSDMSEASSAAGIRYLDFDSLKSDDSTDSPFDFLPTNVSEEPTSNVITNLPAVPGSTGEFSPPYSPQSPVYSPKSPTSSHGDLNDLIERALEGGNKEPQGNTNPSDVSDSTDPQGNGNVVDELLRMMTNLSATKIASQS